MPKPSDFKISFFKQDAITQVFLVVLHLFFIVYYFSDLYAGNYSHTLNTNLDLISYLIIAGIYQFVISNILHYRLGFPTPTLAYWRGMYVLASLCALFLTFSPLFTIGTVIAQCCSYASCAVAVLEYLALVKQNKVEETP